VKLGLLTTVLVAAAVIVVIAVSPVREGMREGVYMIPHSPFAGMPTQARLQRIAQAHPQDAALWLGYAEYCGALEHVGRAGYYGSSETYRHLLTIAPDSAAVRFRYALHAVDEELKGRTAARLRGFGPQ